MLFLFTIIIISSKVVNVVNDYTAFSSTANGSLILETEPIRNEALFESAYVADNRTGVTQGSTVDGTLLTCEASYVGLGTSIPTVSWTLNGKSITNNTIISNAFMSSLEIVNFNLSDAGVYQCIFTDTDADSEVVTSTPFRVDTGTTAVLIIEVIIVYTIHCQFTMYQLDS